MSESNNCGEGVKPHSARTTFSYIVVLYNSAAALPGHLERIAQLTHIFTDDEWIFLDNSPDSSDSSFIAPLINEQAKILRHPENLGFAGGVNRAAGIARGEYIVLINPDLWLDREPLNEVRDQVIGAAIQSPSSWAVGQLTKGRKHIGIHFIGGIWFCDNFLSFRQDPVGPSGGFAIYPTAEFLQAGGFRTELFAWGEDAELALRLRERDIPCRRIDVYFPHEGGHSIRDDRGARRRKAYLLARNRQVVAFQYYSVADLVKFEVTCLLVYVARLPRALRHGTLGAATSGVLAGAKRGIRLRRSRLQNRRKRNFDV